MTTPHLLEKKAAHLFFHSSAVSCASIFRCESLVFEVRRKDHLQFLRQRFDGICDVECFIFTHTHTYIYIYIHIPVVPHKAVAEVSE